MLDVVCVGVCSAGCGVCVGVYSAGCGVYSAGCGVCVCRCVQCWMWCVWSVLQDFEGWCNYPFLPKDKKEVCVLNG